MQVHPPFTRAFLSTTITTGSAKLSPTTVDMQNFQDHTTCNGSVATPCGFKTSPEPLTLGAHTLLLIGKRYAGEPNECPDLKPTFLPPVKRMWANLKCVWPKMRGAVPRVWFVDLLVAVRVLPLQCLSLLLLPLPYTLPRILALQLANPASVVEGTPATIALQFVVYRTNTPLVSLC